MIVFLNPHAHDFLATPVSFSLVKRRGLQKYGYLFEQVLARHGHIDVLIDGTVSSIVPQQVLSFLPGVLRRAILRLEIRQWLRLNRLRAVRVHYSPRGLARPGVALLTFSYKDCVGLFSRRLGVLNAFSLVLVHLSHYMIRTREKSQNIQKIRNALLVGDTDIASNPYFLAFFPEYRRRMLVLPFAVSPRFKSQTPFAERLDKAVATGSFHALDQEIPARYYQDFIRFFSATTYHPTRRMIFERRNLLSYIVDCYVTLYRSYSTKPSRWARMAAHYDISQKRYFSIDLVDLYNRYKFAIVGEELTGFPAVGGFEAMACGCVLLAHRGGYYEGLGLEEGVHYAGHDGSPESILEAVNKLRANPDVAERISQNGKRYVESQMRGTAVFDRLAALLDAELKAPISLQ